MNIVDSETKADIHTKIFIITSEEETALN